MAIRTGGLPFVWWDFMAAVDGAFPQGTGGSAPYASAAVADSATEVRVTFSEEMKHSDPGDAADALNPANYVFSGSVTITAVSVALFQADPTIVVVTVNEMTNGASYTVQVENVESIADVPLDEGLSLQPFTGVGEAPWVDGAVMRQQDNVLKVYIDFDSVMADTGLTEPGNYTFDGPTAISTNAVEKRSSQLVVARIEDKVVNGGLYTVTVTNVTDLAGNPIDPAHDEAEFYGIAFVVVVPTPPPEPTLRGTAAVDRANRAGVRVYLDYSGDGE